MIRTSLFFWHLEFKIKKSSITIFSSYRSLNIINDMGDCRKGGVDSSNLDYKTVIKDKMTFVGSSCRFYLPKNCVFLELFPHRSECILGAKGTFQIISLLVSQK